MEGTVGDRYAKYYPYLESNLEVVIAEGRVTSVTFPDEPHSDAEDEHELLDRIDGYLSGTVEDEFADVEIGIEASPPEQQVFEALRSIPYGENSSVADIARSVPEYDAGTDDDLDAIREILDRNPVPVILPDHRVRDGPSAAPPRVEQRLRSLEMIV